MSGPLIRCTVTVPPIPGPGGFWATRRFFRSGVNLVELTREEVRSIQADARLGLPIQIVEGWKEPSPQKKGARRANGRPRERSDEVGADDQKATTAAGG
jgi:hypothetical protein